MADGETIYNSGCVACHGAGIAGAPRVGDKAAWANRIVQGKSIIYEHALKGFQGTAGTMPAKGGFTHLSDEEVKAATDFMIEASK
jgi:cytochrome c5